MTETTKVQFEVRTKKKLALAAIFDTEPLAVKWLQDWHQQDRNYFESLKLFKVTTQIKMEAV